ncbi:MAG: hypothetical protein AAFX93_00375 [Verrucomicrobiota bacterium]
MKLKNLIAILIVGFLGYFGYKYLVTNFSSEAMVYKRFANALLDGDSARIKGILTEDRSALEAFEAGTFRDKLVNGDVRFSWYEFKDKRVSADGNTVTLIVVQNLRVDPPGSDTFYGEETRRDKHEVTLVKNQSSWEVESFRDTATSRYRADQLAK